MATDRAAPSCVHIVSVSYQPPHHVVPPLTVFTTWRRSAVRPRVFLRCVMRTGTPVGL